MDNIKIIFGHYVNQIPVQFFIMKKNISLLIEDKWRKRDEFASFIVAIDKLLSPKERKL